MINRIRHAKGGKSIMNKNAGAIRVLMGGG